jgi:hypothetical protein
VQCLECRYQLDGLPVHQCPECGRAFDPQKPGDVRIAGLPDPARTQLDGVAMLCAASPLIVTLWMFAYAVGWGVLGRWPETGGRDDPKNIPFVSLMHVVWMFSVLALPVMLGAGLALVVVISRWRRRVEAVMLLAALASWGLAHLLNRWINVWEWFFD